MKELQRQRLSVFQRVTTKVPSCDGRSSCFDWVQTSHEKLQRSSVNERAERAAEEGAWQHRRMAQGQGRPTRLPLDTLAI